MRASADDPHALFNLQRKLVRSKDRTKERVLIVKVMIGFAVLLATILVLAASKPKTFRIQRSVSIDAPPEKVFTLIDNLGMAAMGAPGTEKIRV